MENPSLNYISCIWVCAHYFGIIVGINDRLYKESQSTTVTYFATFNDIPDDFSSWCTGTCNHSV